MFLTILLETVCRHNIIIHFFLISSKNVIILIGIFNFDNIFNSEFGQHRTTYLPAAVR